MRHADGQRLQLKSKLLVGVAGMTAAAMSTAAFAADAAPPPAANTPAAPPPPAAAPAAAPAQAMQPIDPPKWLPYVDIGGGAGSGFAIGRATAFVPFWQDLDSLAFVRFGADTGHRNNDGDFNLGLGYRTKIDSEWILGAFAGFDSTQTEFNHTFNQFSFGLEAMSADWDVRANAYIANKANRPIGDKFQLYIHDTTIAILQGQEAALSGFDGEIGYRVFNTDSTDVRVFAGAYTFHHADAATAGVGASFSFPYHDLTGPKLRAEVNVFDLDMLGPQSRLSIEGQISHDNVHHTSEYIGATLRIALDDVSGPGAQALDDLDRRMADPVRRNDNVLTQWQFNKPEPVIIYNSTVTSNPTNTFYYAEQKSGTGTGTYTDQTTIQDAAKRGAGNNTFIVLTDAGGSKIDATGTTVKGGETLTGAGTFKIRGADSTYPVFTHDFAPGSGPVTLSAKSGNVLNLSGDANVANLSIVGPFVDAIYGANVGNVHIGNVKIDGGGAGTNGIVFKQTNTSGTSNITIASSSITGVTNDGVDLTVGETGSGTSTTNLTFSNGAITAGNHGVNVVSTASGSSNATVYAGIHDSKLTTGGTGAEMTGTTAGSGTLTQTLLVDPTTIHAGDYGIYVHSHIAGGTLTQNIDISDVTLTADEIGVLIDGEATGGSLTQNLSMSDVNISGAVEYGFLLYGHTHHGGQVTQSAAVDHLTIAPTNVPVYIGAYAETGGAITQSVSIDHLVADYGTKYGVNIVADVYHGGTINQGVTLSHAHVSEASFIGIGTENSVKYGGTSLQTINISDLTAHYDGYGAVTASTFATGDPAGDPSIAATYLTVNGATISGSYRGINVFSFSAGNAVTRQDINILNAGITHNKYGVVVSEAAYAGASATQNLYIAYDDISHNLRNGLSIGARAGGLLSFASQYGTIYDVSLNDNGVYGLDIREKADSADVEQQLYIVDVTAEHNSSGGLNIYSYAVGYTIGSYATYPAHAEQDLFVEYSTFSHNANNGISIYSSTAYGAQTDQTLYFYGVHADSNGSDGLNAFTLVGQGGTLNQSLYFTNSTANGNVSNGVEVYFKDYAYSSGGGSAYQTNGYPNLNIVGSTTNNNGQDGIHIHSYDVGPSYLIQHITIDGTKSTGNGNDGLYAKAYAGGYYSANLQYLAISNSHFDNNGTDGASFYASQKFGLLSFGLSLQQISSKSNTFNRNGRNGFSGYINAGDVQGRAEQYITDIGSQFDHNTKYGAFFENNVGNGSYIAPYTCDVVQGVSGGCAIGRQRLTFYGSDLSDNGLGTGAAGLGVITNVYGLGTMYGTAAHGTGATISVIDSTITGNGGDGVFLLNYASGGSYIYQNAVFEDSHIDYNGGSGIQIHSYVSGASTLVQRVGLYSYAGTLSTSYNGGSGVAIVANAADIYSSANVRVLSLGQYAVGNATDGISLSNSASDVGSQAVGHLYAYYGVFAGNDTGIRLSAAGAEASQNAGIGYNLIAGNTNGIAANAATGSSQNIDLYYGNTMANTNDYVFTYDPGATQTFNH